jgi:hypothetical protein
VLINETQVKQYALDRARERWGEYPCGERVSREFLTRADSALREWIHREIRIAPSKGKTLY